MTQPSSTSGPYRFRHKYRSDLHGIRGPWIVEGPDFRMEVDDRTEAALLARKLNVKRHASRARDPRRARARDPRRASRRARDPGRTIYISRSQNLAALIDNAYGHLTSREGSGLMRAIDHAEREGEDPRRAAVEYLREIGVTVHQTEGRDASRRGRRDPQPGTHRGNADLIRWYLKHAHEADRQLFSGRGPDVAERRRKARATTARNVQLLRRVARPRALGFVRSLGYRG